MTEQQAQQDFTMTSQEAEAAAAKKWAASELEVAIQKRASLMPPAPFGHGTHVVVCVKCQPKKLPEATDDDDSY
jgi:hypothetical protein